jgi:hypothetical protein
VDDKTLYFEFELKQLGRSDSKKTPRKGMTSHNVNLKDFDGEQTIYLLIIKDITSIIKS